MVMFSCGGSSPAEKIGQSEHQLVSSAVMSQYGSDDRAVVAPPIVPPHAPPTSRSPPPPLTVRPREAGEEFLLPPPAAGWQRQSSEESWEKTPAWAEMARSTRGQPGVSRWWSKRVDEVIADWL